MIRRCSSHTCVEKKGNYRVQAIGSAATARSNKAQRTHAEQDNPSWRIMISECEISADHQHDKAVVTKADMKDAM